MEKLLDVENVSISFIQYTKGLNQRDLKVITDLTLDISEGEILAVLKKIKRNLEEKKLL